MDYLKEQFETFKTFFKTKVDEFDQQEFQEEVYGFVENHTYAILITIAVVLLIIVVLIVRKIIKKNKQDEFIHQTLLSRQSTLLQPSKSVSGESLLSQRSISLLSRGNSIKSVPSVRSTIREEEQYENTNIEMFEENVENASRMGSILQYSSLTQRSVENEEIDN